MEQLKAFLEKAGTDEEISEKLEALGKEAEHTEKLKAIAAEYGFNITTEEIEEAKTNFEKLNKKLTDEDLEEVTGGTARGTVNRYCPSWCKNRTEYRYACRHPFFWCDHYSCEFSYSKGWKDYYYYACAMGAYPRYLVEHDNTPEM